MGADRLVSAAMRDAVGRLVDWQVSFPVSRADIRRWAVAVHHPDPPPRRYWDDAAVPGGLRAPEEFNPFAWMVADRRVPELVPVRGDTDRIERALGIPGPGLRYLVNGGSKVTYGVPMRPGDVIRSESRLHDYVQREGRSGPLLVTRLVVDWTNQHGELVRSGFDTSIRY